MLLRQTEPPVTPLNPFVRVVAGLIPHPSVPEADLLRGVFLVARRRDKGRHANLWEFPGGKVEQGEEDAGALVRELREELGVAATVGTQVLSVSDLVSEHDSGPAIPFDIVLYHAIVGQQRLLRRVHSEFRWAGIHEIARLDLSPGTRAFVGLSVGATSFAPAPFSPAAFDL